MKQVKKSKLNETMTSRTKATLTRNQSCGNFTYRKQNRPTSCLPKLSQYDIFKKHQNEDNPYIEDSKLDVMNLIIKNSPSQIDTNALKNKIEAMSRINSIQPSAAKTSQLFFRYNVLYGTKTSNIIKTYSPKLRPQSGSVSQYMKKMHHDGKEACVFNDAQIQLLFEAKCKDLNLNAKPELEKRFRDYVQAKCINRRIDLSECKMGFYCAETLRHLITKDNCSGLILQHNSIGDKGIEQLISPIQNNNTLVYLDFSSNDIYFRGGASLLECLISHPSIISLSLSSLEGVNRNRLTADGVKPLERLLKQNKYLEILKLSGNSIKNEGLKSVLIGLNDNKTLKELDISKNEIDEKGLECLPNLLTLTKLTDLNLSSNYIKNEGLILLASSLTSPAMNSIRNLNLAECKLTIEGLKKFFQIISQNTTLQKINLSNNNFSKNGLKSLETSLSTMNIRELLFSSCSLGKQAIDIAELLETISTIKAIDLSNNQIDDKTFLHFAKIPIKNSSIESIDFSKNHLTNVSGKEFFPNLQVSSSLRKVNFYDNQFENSLASVILSCLRANRNIIYLNVSSNQIQLKIMKEIQMRVNNNIKLSKLKFVPYLKAVIKALIFNPDEFDTLKESIELAKREQATLIEKIEEDSEKFAQMKRDEEERITAIQIEKRSQEEELNVLNNELKKVNEVTVKQNDYYTEECEKINNEIKILNQEIGVIERNKFDYVTDRNVYENELKMTQVKTELELKKVCDKVNLAQVMIEMTKNELDGKMLVLDNPVNPQKDASANKEDIKESPPKRKNLSSKRESSRNVKDRFSKKENLIPFINKDTDKEKSKKKIKDESKSNRKESNTFLIDKTIKQNESKRNKLVIIKSNSTGNIINKEHIKLRSLNEKNNIKKKKGTIV